MEDVRYWEGPLSEVPLYSLYFGSIAIHNSWFFLGKHPIQYLLIIPFLAILLQLKSLLQLPSDLYKWNVPKEHTRKSKWMTSG